MQRSYDVFLSHNNAEKPVVEYIARQIVNEGFRPWFDKWELPAGKTWQDGIELGLKNSKACAAFVGPSGITKWHQEEIWIANRMRVESGGGFSVIPVLLPGISAAEYANLPLVLGNTTWVKFTDPDDRQALMQLIAGIAGKAPVPGQSEATSTECPYRGLRYFDVEHSSFFFGREVLTAKMLAAVAPDESYRENRFLGVLGPSGSGKSSVVRAGLIARIRAGAFTGSESWPIVIFRPGRNPVDSLGSALLKTPGFTYGSKPGDLTSDLLRDEKTLHFASTSISQGGPRQRVVVFADQFEELFTQCETDDLRRALIQNLLHASRTLDGQVIVILAMRSDFYGRCADFPGLATALSQPKSHLLVGAMEEQELEEAIVQPARRSGCRVDPQVLQRILAFARQNKGCLPLIQDAMTDLWQRRFGDVISLDAYKKIGGVEGALGRRADQAFANLEPARQKICERIFLRLITFIGGTYVKRPVPFSDFLHAEASDDEKRRTEEVVDLLAGPEARVIIVEAASLDDETARERIIEIVHESLIDGWTLLKTWLSSDQEFQLWRRRLESTKDEWLRLRNDPDLLLRGAPLAEAGRWLKSRPQDLNADEQTFIRESIRAQELRDLQERQRQEAMLRAETQRADAERARAEALTKVTRRTRMLAVSAVALVAAAGAAGAFSLIARARAADAASNRLAALARNQVEGSAEVGLLLALHANKIRPAKPAFEALEYAYQVSRRPLVEEPDVLNIAYSRSGGLLASGHEDHNLRIWDVVSGRKVQELQHPDRVDAVAFNSVGDMIASGCADGIVRVWRVQEDTNELVYQWLVGDGAVRSVDFNQEGSLLATAHWSGKARLWRLNEPNAIAEYAHSIPAAAVDFHPSGEKIAVGYTDGGVIIWKRDSSEPWVVCQTGKKVNDVEFTMDGDHIVVAAGKLALLCEPGSKKSPVTVGGDPIGVAAVAVSATGRSVASAGRSGTFQVLDVQTNEEVLRLAFDFSPLSSIAFQPGRDPAKSEVLSVAGKDGVRQYELHREALTALARNMARQMHAALTKEQCGQYLGGKDCSEIP